MSKKKIKVISIVLVSIIAVLFILNFSITYFINQKLPEIIEEKNDTPFNLTYGKLNFSILSSSISISDIKVSPKNIEDKNDSITKIKKLEIVGVNIYKLLKYKDFYASKIKIYKPNVFFYPEKITSKDNSSKFRSSINVDEIDIKHGKFYYFKTINSSPIIKVDNIDVLFTGVNFNKETAVKKIPFHYSGYNFKIGSVYYKLDNDQFVQANNLFWSVDKLSVSDFQVESNNSEGNKIKPNYTDKDFYDIIVPEISLVNTDWGFDGENQLFFTVDDVNLIKPSINIVSSSKKGEGFKPKEFKETSLLNVKKLNIEDGELNIWYPNGSKKRLSLNKMRSNFEDLKMNQITKSNQFPIDYKNFNIGFNSLYYEINESQYIKSSSVNISKNDVVFNDFKFKPLISAASFLKNKTSSKTLLDIEIPTINLKNTNWGIKNEQLFFHTKSILLDRLDVKLLAEKHQQNNSKPKKHLVDVNLKVDEVKIQQSNVESKDKFKINDFTVLLSGINNEIDKGFSIDNLKFTNPKIKIYKPKVPSKGKPTKKIFNNLINFKSLKIENGNLEYASLNKKTPDFKLNSFQLDLKNVNVDSKTINNPWPFSYKNMLLNAKGIEYEINTDYHLSTSNLQFNDGTLLINQFKLSPMISRKAFISKLKMQEDLYTVSVNKLEGNNVKFGLDDGKNFYFSSQQITVNNLYANIYRSQIPPKNTRIKTMFSEKLRDLKFGLNVNNVNIVNSVLEYEEGNESNGVGKLTFSNINTKIKNLNSGFKQNTLPNVIVDWNSDFMNANLDVLWTFNPMNTSEKFEIAGNIKKMPAKNLDPFLVPYLRVSAQGNFEDIEFDFSGNNISAKGLFDIKYNDLKVNLLKKDGDKKKFLSAIGNVLISKKTGTEGEKVGIKEVKRNQEKSFFNFFLACILEGLKETILII